jgi:hypothetical protein
MGLRLGLGGLLGGGDAGPVEGGRALSSKTHSSNPVPAVLVRATEQVARETERYTVHCCCYFQGRESTSTQLLSLPK